MCDSLCRSVIIRVTFFPGKHFKSLEGFGDDFGLGFRAGFPVRWRPKWSIQHICVGQRKNFRVERVVTTRKVLGRNLRLFA